MKIVLEVTGKNRAELVAAATSEVEMFLGRPLRAHESVQIVAAPILGHFGEHPNVVLWRGDVEVQVS